MTKSLCVYCASSGMVKPLYFEAAAELGRTIAGRGYELIYGGTNVGLMGVVARTVQQGGGRVVGVIPEALVARGIAYEGADELIVTRDMRDRKAVMAERAGAFVALPGGFGTLEELLETITQKQLRYHNKPIVLMNTAGFYDKLIEVFEAFYESSFAKPAYRELYHLAGEPGAVMSYLDSYVPHEVVAKWNR
jgi:cytokinin riboside 5'-monophosphate phosphoribohydrolase